MTSGPASPPVQVFAVEDTTVQLTWRGLPPGPLLFRAGGRTVEAEVGPAGGPGAVVLDGLPPATTVTVTVTGPALTTDLSVQAHTLDRLPGEELCRIATISDLHLGTEVFGRRGTIREDPAPEVPHPQRCAEAAADEAAAWGARRIIAKGDITNNGQLGEWRHYAAFVRRAPVPVDALPGNHDRAFEPGGPGLSPEDAAATFGLSMAMPVSVRDLPGLRVVLADTTTDRHNLGRVSPVADQIVTAVRDAEPGAISLVAMHHQIHTHLTAEVTPVGIDTFEGRRFLRALASTGRPVMVTSGHTHRHRRWSYAGVTATQVGSTKDYPGVWAGYAVHEGGIRQVVRRIARPDCIGWTDHTRRAGFGVWRWVAPGRLDSRCFDLTWDRA